MVMTSKVKEAIRKILKRKESISDDADIDISFSSTIFNDSSYLIYYNTWEVNFWSPVKEQEIRLTEVLFNIEE
jgi:hypothetical protein